MFVETDKNLKVGSIYLMYAAYDEDADIFNIEGHAYGSLKLTPCVFFK